MANPYEVWDTRKSLGVFRDIEPAYTYWLDMFGFSINSTDEWIDFEKLPRIARKLAPFVRPLGSGKPLYEDSSTAFRFKPAYIKVKDAIDPLAPLTKKPGVDRSMLGMNRLTPDQSRDLLRLAMTAQHVTAIQRRWEWMAAQAIINAKITVEGEEYPAVELDFLRAANQTVVKTSGSFWGETGISIFDDIQSYADRMVDAPFGAMPTRITITPKVWKVWRKDEEILKHMDTNIRGERATVERGLISSDKVTKVGELLVGGASGASIEVILYRDNFIDPDTGVQTPFMQDGDIVLSGSQESIMGYRCYGAIIDPHSNYQSLEIFPRSWMQDGDPAVEYMLHQSAPLMVPVNPNATLRATVVDPS